MAVQTEPEYDCGLAAVIPAADSIIVNAASAGTPFFTENGYIFFY
jgi:hypothetical protein